MLGETECPKSPRLAYSNKAETYHRYRWDYAPLAIQTIIDRASLSSPGSCLADVGAGTGILTKHFVDVCSQVFAIEVNREMRKIAKRTLVGPNCRVIAARAERTTLADHSVDVITVAQAIHWFDPKPTLREFHRILRPNGWLAILRNYSTDGGLGRALLALAKPQNGVSQAVAGQPEQVSADFYFGNGSSELLTFPFALRQDWEHFLGAILSTAGMPDEKHPLYPNLERAAKQVFEAFSEKGFIRVEGETELHIGQPRF